jgi:uncharacterized membrane protein
MIRRGTLHLDDAQAHAAASEIAREHQAGGSCADNQHVRIQQHEPSFILRSLCDILDCPGT